MNRSVPVRLLLILVLVVGSIGTLTMTVTAQQQIAEISNVSFTPSEPAPGEEVRVETTISNTEYSSVEFNSEELNRTAGDLTITDVYVRNQGGGLDKARVEDIGTISMNESSTVPMSISFEETGTKRLTVHVVVRDQKGNSHHYERPVHVTVEKSDEVQLSFSASDAVEDGQTTVNATVSNSYAETITNVRLALNGTGTVDNSERVAASIESGSERSFRYDVTFNESGRQSIMGEVTYTTADGVTRTTTASMPIDVDEPEELPVSFSTNDAVAGDDTTVNVTVSNSYSGTLRNVQVDLSGDSATVENSERIRSSIASEAEQTFEYGVEFSEPGAQELTAELTYTTAGDVTRTTTRSVSVDVAEPNVDVSLSASSNDSVATVEISNFGNTELSEVEITATADDGVIARKLVPDISPDSSETVTFDIDDSVNGSVTFTGTYEAAGDTYTAETTEEDNEEVLGEISLTGVEVTQSGSSLTIDGDASNVGSTDAESVLLAVQGSDSGSEYFVGTIEASEFATFELSAQSPGSSSSIPVEISYIVDDERVTTVQQIEVSSTNMSEPIEGGQAPGDGGQAPGDGGQVPGDGGQAPGDGGQARGNGGQGPPGGSGGLLGGGLLSMLPVAFGVVLIGVVGFGVYRWRQYS